MNFADKLHEYKVNEILVDMLNDLVNNSDKELAKIIHADATQKMIIEEKNRLLDSNSKLDEYINKKQFKNPKDKEIINHFKNTVFTVDSIDRYIEAGGRSGQTTIYKKIKEIGEDYEK